MKYWSAIAALIAGTIGAAGMFLFLQHASNEPQTEVRSTTEESQGFVVGEMFYATSTATSSAETKREEPFTSSLEALMAERGDYGCHYKSAPEEGDFTGMVYVSDGRARGTVVGDAMTPGTIISFLFNAEYVYVWYAPGFLGTMEGASLLLEATTTKDKSETRHNVMDNLTDLYGCVSWEFDDNFFELPDDILFVRPEEGWTEIEVEEN